MLEYYVMVFFVNYVVLSKSIVDIT